MFCRTLLAERLKLESNMQSMCPRFILFCMMMTLLGMSLLGPNITELGTVNHLLVHAFRLEDVKDEIRTNEDVREFIDNFAETAASFYPVNFQYVPDPELMRITQGIRQYQEGRTLPAELRPRLRTSFTLVAWVASDVETWIVRTEPRGMLITSGMQSCWAWRYPSRFVYGYHDIAIDMPPLTTTEPLSVSAEVQPPPSVQRTMTMEAVVINATHASFYRDAILLDVVSLPRSVTDCQEASLIVGDSTGVRIGQLTYIPRALSSVELFEVRSDGMPLLDLVSGGTATTSDSTSDADFTTERVAMEHASAQQDRAQEADLAASRTTRTTLAVRSEVMRNRDAGPEGSQTSSDTLNSMVPLGLPDQICYADEACQLTFAMPTGGNCTTTAYMRFVEGGSCAANVPTASLLGCSATCVTANGSSSSSVSYDVCTPTAGFEPTVRTACAASACEGPWLKLGVVSFEYHDWAYVIDSVGESYSGVVSDRYNTPDPHPTVNSTTWSVSFNFRMPDATFQLPLMKTRRPYGPNDVIPDEDVCWALYISGIGDSVEVLRTLQSWDLAMKCDADAIDVDSFKHLAFVANGSTLALYLDGQPHCKVTNVPPLTDCEGGVLRLGGAANLAVEDGGHILWVFGSLYGLKKHSVPLTSAEVQENSICRDVPAVDDVLYMDAIGNKCEWYARFRNKKGFSLCEAETRAACPIACGLTRSCPKRSYEDRLFERTQLLSPPAVCNTRSGMIDVQQQLALHHNLSAAAESASRRRLGHLPQVTSDNVMDYVASGACSTELPLLENYDVTDFTIVMWTRGKNHMIQLLHSYDAVNGLSKGVFARYAIEFTTPSVTWTLDLESGQDSDLRLNGGASVKEDQWIMRAFSYNGTHMCSFLNGESACRYDPRFVTSRVHSIYVAPLSASTSKLDSMLMSPVRTYSPAMSEAALTRMYYTELSIYREQVAGPRSTNYLMESKAKLDIGQYPRMTYIFVPPLTFQSRYQRGECETFAQSTSTVFESLRTAKCSGYDCGNLDPIVQCIESDTAGNGSSHSDPNTTYFGRTSSRYQDSSVFSEFLHTFRSDVLVYRDVDGSPKMLDLEAYINGLTKKQTILALTYTPMLNTATKLAVEFDFTKPAIKTIYKIEHFRGLTGDVKTTVLGSDIALMVCASLMFLLLLLDLWQQRQTAKKLKRDLVSSGFDDVATPSRRSQLNRFAPFSGFLMDFLLRWLLETALCVCIFVYALVHYGDAEQSNGRLQEIYGSALNVPWTSQEVQYSQKVSDFFTAVDDIENLLLNERRVRDLSYFLVLCCVVRVVGYLTVHPRINFLAATLVQSGDDIIHFTLSFSMIFMMLAVLAHAQFGESNLQYSTLTLSILTQFKVITAGIEDYGDESTLFVLYIIMVYLAQGLFMLNFFLAIVVDAYGEVKRKVVEQVTEQSFWRDSIDIALLAIRRPLAGWPPIAVIISRVEKQPNELITRDELIRILGDEQRAESFIDYFGQYEFLLSSSEDAAQFIKPPAKEGDAATDLPAATEVSKGSPDPDARVTSLVEENARLRQQLDELQKDSGKLLVVHATPTSASLL